MSSLSAPTQSRPLNSSRPTDPLPQQNTQTSHPNTSPNLPKSVQNLLLENKQLKVNFDVLKKQYDKLHSFHDSQVKQWRQSLVEKTKEFENLRVASSTSADTLQEITQRYYEELEMRKQLEMRLDQLQNTEHGNKQLVREVKMLEREREEMKLRMEREFASRYLVVEQRLVRLQNQNDELLRDKLQSSHWGKEVDELRNALDETRVRLQQLEEENSALRRGGDYAVKERDDLILNLRREKTTFEVKSQSLQTELASRDRKILTLEKTIHELTTDRDAEQKRRKDVESTLVQVRSELDTLQVKHAAQSQEYKRHEASQITDLKHERNQLRNQVTELRQRVDALVVQKQEIIHEHKNQESADVDKLRHELRALHDKLQEAMDKNHQQQQELFSKDATYKNQIHTLKSRLDSQAEKISSARLEKEKHEQHIAELKGRLSQVEHDYETTRHQLHAIESSHDELKVYTERLRRELADTEGNFVKVQARAQRDELEVKDLRRRVDDLSNIEKKLKTEKAFIIEQAKQKVDALKGEVKSLTAKLKTEQERVEETKRKTSKRVVFLSDQVKTLNAQLAREQSIARRAKEQAFDNEQEWQKKCFELKRVKDKYKAMLEQTRGSVAGMGMRTASPIVVKQFGGSRVGYSPARPSVLLGGSDTDELYEETVRDYEQLRRPQHSAYSVQ